MSGSELPYGYEIVKPLASGSFGQIFVVQKKKERRKYVLKKISTALNELENDP